jgi:hypothetical protein
MINGIIQKAPIGNGLDVNQPINAEQAANFKAAGFGFIIRYIPRTAELVAGNLTTTEANDILSAKIALSVVQHCPEPNWMPTAELGMEYGNFAAAYAQKIGLPAGMHIWLDLEMVNPTATVADITAYCVNWFNAVQAGGYLGGLYVGWNTMLSSYQLYMNLPFRAYWKGYNADIAVATRGYQIKQSPQKVLSGINYDPDTISPDDIGDLPMLLYPS